MKNVYASLLKRIESSKHIFKLMGIMNGADDIDNTFPNGVPNTNLDLQQIINHYFLFRRFSIIHLQI